RAWRPLALGILREVSNLGLDIALFQMDTKQLALDGYRSGISPKLAKQGKLKVQSSMFKGKHIHIMSHPWRQRLQGRKRWREREREGEREREREREVFIRSQYSAERTGERYNTKRERERRRAKGETEKER